MPAFESFKSFCRRRHRVRVAQSDDARRRGREDAAFVSVRWCRWLCHRPVVVAADRSPLTPTPIDGARARSFADALLFSRPLTRRAGSRTTDPFSPLLVSDRHQPGQRSDGDAVDVDGRLKGNPF